jgi:RNA 2',3'-cyclic 3'-phosphodiesterase
VKSAPLQGKPVLRPADCRYLQTEMHRLFVAIRPPQPVRSTLLEAMHGVRGVHWQDEDQLHLTLRFIGEVDRHKANDVAAALVTIRHRSFSLALNGVGQFERRGKGALWAGVTPQDDLRTLHKKVDQVCQRAGIAPDPRAYHPHITLARFGRGSGPIDAFAEASGGLLSAPFTVDEFRLYESHLKSDGALYNVVERYPLG